MAQRDTSTSSFPAAAGSPLPPGAPLATGCAATTDLTADGVAAILTGPDLGPLLDHLDIVGRDRAELEPLITAVVADDALLGEVTRVANALRREAGLHVTPPPLGHWKKDLDAAQQVIAPGEGLLPILAHIVSTDTVRAWHTARGLEEQQSWGVLADLGQQMRVHRTGTGRLGLHQLSWTAMNWSGGLFHLGRLQFDLHHASEQSAEQDRWVIGTHIPATGPLTPAAVDDSFARAREFFPTHFPDLALGRPDGAPAFGSEFTCHSWLMNPQLPEFLGKDSNIGAFVDRWQVVETSPGDDSAAFFVFGARPPYDPADFPRRTTLEKEIAARLSDGRGWLDGLGRIVFDQA
jgi:hypothetical protein